MPDRLLEPLATLGLAIVMNGWIGQALFVLVPLMLLANWKQRRRNRNPYLRNFPSWNA